MYADGKKLKYHMYKDFSFHRACYKTVILVFLTHFQIKKIDTIENYVRLRMI